MTNLTDLIPDELRDPQRLFTLDEFADLPRPSCPTCGGPVWYRPKRPAGFPEERACRGQRVVGVGCSACRVFEPFGWQPAD